MLRNAWVSFYDSFTKSAKLLMFVFMVLLLLIFVLSYLTWNYFVPPETHIVPPLSMDKTYQFMFGFLLFFGPLIYLINSFFAKEWIKPDWGSLILYAGMLLLCGCILEISINFLAEWMSGQPLWHYHIWPLHRASTSGAQLIVWPLYGVHLYLFSRAMYCRNSPLATENIIIRALLLAIDAMFMEVLANLFSLVFFQSFHFYYYLSDFYHMTTGLVFLPYFASGLIGMTILYLLDKPSIPRKGIGIFAFVAGIVLLFVL